MTWNDANPERACKRAISSEARAAPPVRPSPPSPLLKPGSCPPLWACTAGHSYPTLSGGRKLKTSHNADPKCAPPVRPSPPSPLLKPGSCPPLWACTAGHSYPTLGGRKLKTSHNADPKCAKLHCLRQKRFGCRKSVHELAAPGGPSELSLEGWRVTCRGRGPQNPGAGMPAGGLSTPCCPLPLSSGHSLPASHSSQDRSLRTLPGRPPHSPQPPHSVFLGSSGHWRKPRHPAPPSKDPQPLFIWEPAAGFTGSTQQGADFLDLKVTRQSPSLS